MTRAVLLVDDHHFLREAFAEVMQRTFPAAEVLQAGRLDAARAMLIQRSDIDLVLLDLHLPDGDGLQALPTLLASTRAREVVVSADERPEIVQAALATGIAGYVPKTMHSGEMLAALKQVSAGARYMPALQLTSGGKQAPGLSPRQAKVLELLCSGASNKVIAQEMGITEATVKTHMTAILEHFGVKSRAQVMAVMGRDRRSQRPRQY